MLDDRIADEDDLLSGQDDPDRPRAGSRDGARARRGCCSTPPTMCSVKVISGGAQRTLPNIPQNCSQSAPVSSTCGLKVLGRLRNAWAVFSWAMTVQSMARAPRVRSGCASRLIRIRSTPPPRLSSVARQMRLSSIEGGASIWIRSVGQVDGPQGHAGELLFDIHILCELLHRRMPGLLSQCGVWRAVDETYGAFGR